MNRDNWDVFIEGLGREALSEIQLARFQTMLEPLLVSNAFYRRRLGDAGVESAGDVRSFDDHRKLPFTTKQELVADQLENPPYGSNLTFPREQYIRIHQTSGTTGEPLRWLDTRESWHWWARCWGSVYRAAGVNASDRIFFGFSFGPFIGFWSGYEGSQEIGALAIPGGGMTSNQRVRSIVFNDISVLVCTPTYALHLAEVAEQDGIDIASSNVRATIHAGEPGASLPGVRERIEEAWGARCYDHSGATEVGAWGYTCQAQAGVHLNEGEFISEVIDPVSGEPADEGELVVTNLGRVGMPVIRYRTGDHVKIDSTACECGRTFRRLQGGVIGRVDDALIVRGVNVFPSAIDDVVRRFREIGEFAVDVFRRDELDELVIRIETVTDAANVAKALGTEIRNALGLRIVVEQVPSGTLPRFDLKARRFTDHRQLE